MIIAVSPYHLTTREPPAMAAMLLASRVVTFMPGVFAADEPGAGGRDHVRQAAQSSLRYARLLESWGWSMPLWHAGVIDSSHAGDDAAGDVRAAWDRLLSDDRYAALRPFVRQSLGDDQTKLVDAVAADVLKGGPDPAILVPLLAGLDRFASRHGLVSARAQPASVAQKAEAALAAPLSRVVVPLILQGAAEALLFARDELAAELDDLRAALASLTALAAERPAATPGAVAAANDALMRAALTYERAFSRALPLMQARQDPDEVQLRAGPVSLAVSGLPADAVLRSSCSAAQTLLRTPAPRAAKPAGPAAATLPVLADALDYGLFAALTVKPLGRPTAPSLPPGPAARR